MKFVTRTRRPDMERQTQPEAWISYLRMEGELNNSIWDNYCNYCSLPQQQQRSCYSQENLTLGTRIVSFIYLHSKESRISARFLHNPAVCKWFVISLSHSLSFTTLPLHSRTFLFKFGNQQLSIFNNVVSTELSYMMSILCKSDFLTLTFLLYFRQHIWKHNPPLWAKSDLIIIIIIIIIRRRRTIICTWCAFMFAILFQTT